MRFGLNTLLVSSGFCDAEIPLIQEFKSYGADVIELAIADVSAVTASTVGKALKEADFERPITCGMFPEGRDLRGSAEEAANTTNYMSELIDFAGEIGSSVVCGPFYSYVGRCGRHTPEEREAQSQLLAERLLPLCTKAEAAGIVLAMEPLNRFETDCINTLDQAVSLIERVGNSALKIHADTFHMHIEEDDSAAALVKAADHIGHVHASASHRGLLGKDQVRWQEALTALHQTGYDGDIVIESFSEDNEVIARAAAIWRTLYDSPRQLSVEGLAFLRKSWQLAAQTGVESA